MKKEYNAKDLYVAELRMVIKSMWYTNESILLKYIMIKTSKNNNYGIDILTGNEYSGDGFNDMQLFIGKNIELTSIIDKEKITSIDAIQIINSINQDKNIKIDIFADLLEHLSEELGLEEVKRLIKEELHEEINENTNVLVRKREIGKDVDYGKESI